MDQTPPLGAVTQQVLSRDNLEKIIAQYNLFPNATDSTSNKSLAGRLRKAITIETEQAPIDGTYRHQTIGFTLNYTNWNPETAAVVTNALATSYRKTAQKVRVAQAKKNAASLSASMAVVSKKISTQQQAIKAFNEKHLGALPQQKDFNMSQLSRLYGKLRADQQGELNAVNRRTELLERMDKSDNSSLPQLKQKLSDLKLKYTDQYPAVINLKRKIQTLENESRNGDNNESSSLQSQLNDVNLELQQFKASEKKTRKQISDLERKIARLPITGQQFHSLSRENTQTNTVYANLLKQYEQARVIAVTAGQGAPPYTVIDPALVPSSPLGPKRLRFGVMLIILCAIAALAAAMIAEKRDTTFHTLDDMRDFTSAPILATVPVIQRRRDKTRNFLRLGGMVVLIVCGMAILGGLGYAGGHGNQTVSKVLSSHNG